MAGFGLGSALASKQELAVAPRQWNPKSVPREMETENGIPEMAKMGNGKDQDLRFALALKL